MILIYYHRSTVLRYSHFSHLFVCFLNRKNGAQRYWKFTKCTLFVKIRNTFSVRLPPRWASIITFSRLCCAEILGPQSLPVSWMRSITRKAEGLIVICYSLGSTYTWKNFTEPLSAKSSLGKIDDDKCSGSALLKQMEEVRAILPGCMASRCQNETLNGLYHKPGSVGGWKRCKEERPKLKSFSPDISGDWGLITFSCEVKDEEPWDSSVFSWHEKYVLFVATVATIRLKKKTTKQFLNMHV